MGVVYCRSFEHGMGCLCSSQGKQGRAVIPALLD